MSGFGDRHEPVSAIAIDWFRRSRWAEIRMRSIALATSCLSTTRARSRWAKSALRARPQIIADLVLELGRAAGRSLGARAQPPRQPMPVKHQLTWKHGGNEVHSARLTSRHQMPVKCTGRPHRAIRANAVDRPFANLCKHPLYDSGHRPRHPCPPSLSATIRLRAFSMALCRRSSRSLRGGNSVRYSAT